MLNLAEYRSEDHQPCRLPALGLPGRRPASSSTRTARSSAPGAIAAPISTAPPRPNWSRVTARLNNVLKRFGAGWALFFEAERDPGATSIRRARFADPASWLVDQERYAAFSADGAHHESRYYLTFLYLPPPDARGPRRAACSTSAPDGDRRRDRAARASRMRIVTETDRALADAGARSCPRRSRSTDAGDAHLPARHHLRQAPAGGGAGHPDAPRCRPVRHAVARAASSRSSATSTCAC